MMRSRAAMRGMMKSIAGPSWALADSGSREAIGDGEG